uniref:Alternative protein STYK1 n=1 Tax=Homo sapiens TaxID=9606 RepID=L8ECH9_HUMAN|nr:alternative protein STYK1 [Homo sapiens]
MHEYMFLESIPLRTENGLSQGHKGRNGTWILDLPLHISREI